MLQPGSAETLVSFFSTGSMNKNPVPGLGPIEATNPCGEQPLLPHEGCNLGSINLAGCVRKGELDEEMLATVVRLGVQFLDAVIDVNTYPVPEIREQTLSTRKIGLGVMGLADALIAMEIAYESAEGLSCTGSHHASHPGRGTCNLGGDGANGRFISRNRAEPFRPCDEERDRNHDCADRIAPSHCRCKQWD